MREEFDLEVYNQSIVIYTGDFEKVLSDNGLEGFEDAEAVTFKTDGKYCIAFRDNSSKTANIQAHEAVHLASYIYQDIGAFHDLKNQEPFAYLVGYIAELINSTRK